MQLLFSTARNYSWGSRTLIPTLLGQKPSDAPVAELWFGAHPGAPSSVEVDGSARGLDEVISGDPQATLGDRVRQDYGDRLPFLMKILAAAEPLSLQAHPTMAQAQEGFARENAAGIALNDTHRNYKDDSHKPEIIIALTEFYAMAGFRPLAQTRELFAALNCPELDRYLSMLSGSPEHEGADLRALFTTWITIPTGARKELIRAVIAAGQSFLDAAEEPADEADWKKMVLSTVLDINAQYPGDIGVLGALLLNHIKLAPGEAVYLDAGQLHAYVSGMGVEVMANSDNVLRGGLTPKYVDVPELVKVLKFESLDNPRVQQEDRSGLDSVTGAEAWNYPVPVSEFAVTRVELGSEGTVVLDFDGPAIALCTAGDLCVRDAGGDLSLSPGHAVWLPADAAPVTVSSGGQRGQLFVARA